MVQTSFFKVHTGDIFSILSSFECSRAMKINELNKFIESVGAVKGRWAAMGTAVIGLYFGLRQVKGWRPMGKRRPGYFRPRVGSAKGKEHQAALKQFQLLTGEDLAHQLKLPPFFMEPFVGNFCTSVESNMVGGVFYLQAPAVMTRALVAMGAQEITKTQHDLAMKAKRAAT